MSKSDKKYENPDALIYQLQSLFVSCKSLLGAALRSLEKAHRYGLSLEIAGRTNPGYDLYLQIVNNLGVSFEERDIPVNFRDQPVDWLSDSSSKNLHVWIPPIKYRLADMHVLVPFCFQHHARNLQARDPSYELPKVDNLYLLLIWAECFGESEVSLPNRIFQDLIALESRGSISVYRYRGSRKDDIRTVNKMAATLAPLSQMYLGFRRGEDGKQWSRSSGISNHVFNEITGDELFEQGISPTDLTKGPPWLVQNYEWDADKVNVILKNAHVHFAQYLRQTIQEFKRVISCLDLRLQGRSEDDIMENMGFESREKYDKWLVRQAIDIDNSRYRDPYEMWLTACEYFEIKPTSELAESLLQRDPDWAKPVFSQAQESDDSESNLEGTDETAKQTNYEPIPGFRHSKDYRSLLLPDGESASLTERQAHVIQLLYEALLAGTPELGQAYLINEVYGEVKENRLKRLFRDAELYDKLMEKGSKRGLVRLRTSFS